jgi:hypothetical protein
MTQILLGVLALVAGIASPLLPARHARLALTCVLLALGFVLLAYGAEVAA